MFKHLVRDHDGYSHGDMANHQPIRNDAAINSFYGWCPHWAQVKSDFTLTSMHCILWYTSTVHERLDLCVCEISVQSSGI